MKNWNDVLVSQLMLAFLVPAQLFAAPPAPVVVADTQSEEERELAFLNGPEVEDSGPPSRVWSGFGALVVPKSTTFTLINLKF